ncbi:FCS-Like Zinc finger 11 [Linum perenne]
MLRKRTRSVHKDQPQMGLLLKVHDSGCESHSQSESHRTSSLFTVPRLFVGFSSKGLPDSDSVKSPKSPLDLKVFSNVGNPHVTFPRSPHQKSWDRSRLGLSIVDCLVDDDDGLVKGSGKVPRSSESKNILFGPGVRNKTSKSQAHTNNSFEATNSLPRNFAILPRNTHTKSPLQKGSSDVLFEIGVSPEDDPEPFGRIRSHSLDSCRSFSNLSSMNNQKSKPSLGTSRLSNLTTAHLNPPHGFVGRSPEDLSGVNLGSALPLPAVTSGNECISTLSVSASEIELSEDYTCVISHGPNPKKTHIYGDCVLECHSDNLSSLGNKGGEEIGLPSWNAVAPASSLASDHFLSFCYYCNKKLEDGKDIYIYRGEKAFCSLNCRSQEIMIDEEFEEENTTNDSMGEVLKKTMKKSSSEFEEDSNELSESSILYSP